MEAAEARDSVRRRLGAVQAEADEVQRLHDELDRAGVAGSSSSGVRAAAAVRRAHVRRSLT